MQNNLRKWTVVQTMPHSHARLSQIELRLLVSRPLTHCTIPRYGQPLCNGQEADPQSVRYSEAPLYARSEAMTTNFSRCRWWRLQFESGYYSRAATNLQTSRWVGLL